VQTRCQLTPAQRAPAARGQELSPLLPGQDPGRRNRYHIQAHLPLPERTSQERTIGDVLALLAGAGPAGT
jgi:hypothetical protein